MKTGARYEIAIDGTTRTYRDRKELAIEAATLLKTTNWAQRPAAALVRLLRALPRPEGGPEGSGRADHRQGRGQHHGRRHGGRPRRVDVVAAPESPAPRLWGRDRHLERQRFEFTLKIESTPAQADALESSEREDNSWCRSGSRSRGNMYQRWPFHLVQDRVPRRLSRQMSGAVLSPSTTGKPQPQPAAAQTTRQRD